MEQSTAVWSDVADTAVLVCITPKKKQEGSTKQKLGRSQVLHSLLKTGEQQNDDLLILSPPNKQFLNHTNLFSLSYNNDHDEDSSDNSSSDSSSAPPRLSKLSLTSSDDDSTPHSSVNNKKDHSAAFSFSSASSDDHHHDRTKENETFPPCCGRLSGDSGHHETQSSSSDTEEENYEGDESLVDIDLEESLRRRESSSRGAASESDKDLMHQISKALQLQTIMIPSTETAKQSLDQIGKTTKQSMNQLGKLFMSSPLQIPKGGQTSLQNLFASPTSKKQAINCKLLDDLPTLSDDTDDDDDDENGNNSMDNEINNNEELEKEMNTNGSDEAARPTMKEYGEQNEIPPDLSPQFIELQRTMENRKIAAENNNNQLVGGSIRILDSILSFQQEIMDELPDFKPHFEMVLTELQRTAIQQTTSFFHQQGGGGGGETEVEEEENATAAAAVATNQQQQEETAKVLANLVAAASADRAALVSLTQSVHRLTEQIEAKDKEIADLRSELRTTTSSNDSNILSCSEGSNYDYIHEANLNNEDGQKPITKPEECQKEISAVTI